MINCVESVKEMAEIKKAFENEIPNAFFV